MQLLARYIRIYALRIATEATPRSHSASPVHLVDFPSVGIESKIHIGAVPTDVMEALKCQRAWLERVFLGGCKSVDELRSLAANIPDEAILADAQPDGRHRALKSTWYATIYVDDHVEIPADPQQKLFGVCAKSFVGLDNPAFLEKHTETLDQLAVKIAMAIAPYRYDWPIFNGPIVYFPTGVTSGPLQVRMGRVRALGAPSPDKLDLSCLWAGPTKTLQNIPMVLHFIFVQ